ncbi:MAG: PQQ-dependent sugar dehydrogenase, partial [Henriciella sp.]
MTDSFFRSALLSISILVATACATAQSTPGETMSVTGTEGTALSAEVLESFDGAWAMAFLPDGKALVTEQDGDLWLLGADGAKLGEISGVPAVEMRGQGGLGDVIV